jgi:hypothetical protein
MICQRALHEGRRGTPTGRLVVRILAWGADFLVQSPVRGPSRAPSSGVLPNPSPRFVSPPLRVTERDGSDHAEAPAIIYLSRMARSGLNSTR